MGVALLFAFSLARADLPDDDRRRQASAHYDQGTTYYDLGKYADAVKEYEAAYQLKNEPALLFNIAQAYRLGGNAPEALRAYKAFLRRVPDAPNREEVIGHIDNLQKLIEQQKAVSTRPSTGTIAPGQRIPPSEQPPAQSALAPAATVQAAPEKRRSVARKPWLWVTVVGAAVVVAGGVTLGVILGSTPRDPAATMGIARGN